jgi:DNA-binding beta-propeller fold protein YncE
MKLRCFVAAAFISTSLIVAGGAAASTVVMTGLDNPRGLAFGPEGALYVAEAGRGGAGPCIVLRGMPQCYGPTGRVSKLWHGIQSDVATGLPSTISPAGDATGPHDISLLGRGNAQVTIGWGGDPALRATPPTSIWQQFGHLARVTASGKWRLEDDVSAYESEANPDGGPRDSNPYGDLVLPGSTLVAEAGGNDLLQVAASGDISTLAVFPSRTTVPQHSSCLVPGFPPFTDSVPTAVTVGPDGAYYVGELTGAPFCAGNANVYRLVPGQTPTVYCPGFTTIIDLTFGPDGNLYVAQHSNGPVFFATPGNVVRVGPGCSKTPVTGPLNRPGGLAFGPDGSLYVSVNSTSVGAGQVLRFEP